MLASTTGFGKARAISPWRVLLPCTGMLLSPCKHVPNMSTIGSPNERSRVGFLLDAIQCPDHKLQAAMASIDSDDTEDGLRNNFEAAASALVPNVEFTYSINSCVVYRLELLESYGHYLTTAPASTGGPSNHVTGKYRYLVALPTLTMHERVSFPFTLRY